MPFIGPWEIALILVIVLIIFGPKKLPELARSIGDAIRQYRQATEGLTAPPPATSAQPAPGQKSTDILIQTAKQLGIQTEGKTMEEISREITERAKKEGEAK
ncbi:twin-arginine translocase TatA/TatE family subunit [Candidatus Bathyarchaeota archaeon]|nr:twin-arginine translocase TatA/TatE family subunit [Candidatus Bathyarchaeota archaeon]